MDPDILTIADTIYWLATKRQEDKDTMCQSLVSQIYSVHTQVGLALVPYYTKEIRSCESI